VENEFVGSYENKVDGKGRVSIPVKFRRVLQNCDDQYAPGGGPRLYITYGAPNKNYLECWSGNAYDKLMRQIRAMPDGTPARNAMSFFYRDRCEAMVIDDTGRLVIPPKLRAMIDLGDLAYFGADGEKFLLMNEVEATRREAAMVATFDDLKGDDPHFDLLSLLGKDPVDAVE
jgi:MraZ protein